MNLGQSIPLAFKKFKGYSIRGTPISSTDPNYIDLANLMYDLANDAQMDLCHISKIEYVENITQNPIINLLGSGGFDLAQHLPNDGKAYIAQGANSFNFAIDRPCTLTFEQSTNLSTWTALNGFYDVSGVDTAFSGSIAVTGITSFKQLKGLLTLNVATNYVKITVSSASPLNSMNRALFAYTYPTCADVPTYSAFIPYEITDKYMEFNKMMRKFDTRQYEENADFKGPLKNANGKWEIFINWYLTGQFEIHLWIYPDTIDKDTSPTYEFQVGLDAQPLIPYYMAGYSTKDQNIGVQLINQYYELRNGLTTPKITTSSTVTNSLWGV